MSTRNRIEDWLTPATNPVHAAEFFMSVKTAGWDDPPAQPGELEGATSVPVEQVVAGLKLQAEQVLRLHLAAEVYSASCQSAELQQRFRAVGWTAREASSELLREMAHLGGTVHLDPVENPPADKYPETIVPRMVRALQEVVAGYRGLVELLGDNAFGSVLHDHIKRAYQHIQELSPLIPAAPQAPAQPDLAALQQAMAADPQAPVEPGVDPAAAPAAAPSQALEQPPEDPSMLPKQAEWWTNPALAAAGGAAGGAVAGSIDRGSFGGAAMGALGGAMGGAAGALVGDVVAAFLPGAAKHVSSHGGAVGGALTGYEMMMSTLAQPQSGLGTPKLAMDKQAFGEDLRSFQQMRANHILEQQQRHADLAGRVARGKMTPEQAEQKAHNEAYWQTNIPVSLAGALGSGLLAKNLTGSPALGLLGGALGGLATGTTVGHWAGNQSGESAVNQMYGSGAAAFQQALEMSRQQQPTTVKQAGLAMRQQLLELIKQANFGAEMSAPSPAEIDPQVYAANEQAARQAQNQNEAQFYRQELEATKQQNLQLQQSSQQQAQQLEQMQQEQQMVGSQIAEVHQQAMAAEDKALQATTQAAQMRMAGQRMRQQMMEMASQDPDQMAAQSIQQSLQEQQAPMQQAQADQAAAEQQAMAAQQPSQDPGAQQAAAAPAGPPAGPPAEAPKMASVQQTLGDVGQAAWNLAAPTIRARGPYAAGGALLGAVAPIETESPMEAKLRQIEQSPDADPETVALLREQLGVQAPASPVMQRLRNALLAGSAASVVGPALVGEGSKAIGNAQYLYNRATKGLPL